MGFGLGNRKGTKKSSNNPQTVMASARNERKLTSKILNFPVKPLSPHGIQFIFKKYDFSQFVASDAGRRGTRIAGNKQIAELANQLIVDLPFPQTLTDATGLEINGFERDLVTAAVGDTLTKALSSQQDAQGTIERLAGRLQNLGGELASAYQSGVVATNPDGSAKGFAGGAGAVANKIYEDLSKTLNIGMSGAKLLGAYFAQRFGSDVGKTLAMDSGFAINPQATLAFEGVNLKTYSFEWELFPSNAADSQRIKDLVNAIKRRVLPTLSGGGFGEKLGEAIGLAEGNRGALERVFLSYPDVIIINLIGVDESHFPLFKPAMCTGVDIDYGPGGNVVIAKGGVPSAVKLTMNFSELVIHTAEDYGEPNLTFDEGEDTPTDNTSGASGQPQGSPGGSS